MPELVHYIITETREIEVVSAHGRLDALTTADCHFVDPARCSAMHHGSVVAGSIHVVETTIMRKGAGRG